MCGLKAKRTVEFRTLHTLSMINQQIATLSAITMQNKATQRNGKVLWIRSEKPLEIVITNADTQAIRSNLSFTLHIVPTASGEQEGLVSEQHNGMFNKRFVLN